ncbi:hypothetical protein [Paraburkholderia fungorum]|uniref:Uncharacterized protein n=1 Tax=Paraburkholderia fungorum TaxID=134537 RepID=A0AAW3USW9_9BURK|nr:hypothetical protein [Paraburkholderia fungorum]MBB5540587.1 hypothetical protein [Paraburkholderia fungorum]MBB6201722.1 hypothetical protein [Paraburkholderia fungorum]
MRERNRSTSATLSIIIASTSINQMCDIDVNTLGNRNMPVSMGATLTGIALTRVDTAHNSVNASRPPAKVA